MILMYSEQVNKLRNGDLSEIRYPTSAKAWKTDTVHQVKTEILGPVRAYARITEICKTGEEIILRIERVTVFEYLKQKHPDYMQMEIF